MKIFKCPECSSKLYFENSKCNQCKNDVGFDSKSLEFRVLQKNNTQLKPNNSIDEGYCANFDKSICNWIVEEPDHTFCKSCELTRKIPHQNDAEGIKKWNLLEKAKRRLFYQILQLKLPIHPKTIHSDKGLVFDFLDKFNPEGLATGHKNGTITILLEEADSVERELIRKKMSEPYRTLIGHFRHEIGHYFWSSLIDDKVLNQFRNVFGDERVDYTQSLNKHYNNEVSMDWQDNYISSYASSHPWEDWAETWAHYLHLLDTLETAHYAGVGLCLNENKIPALCPNPYQDLDFKEILDWSIELTCAGNSLNRSMGLQDIYPFIIPKPVYQKLNFIHQIIENNNYGKSA